MDDSEIIIAHNIFINKGAYAILLGSGVSRSAGIPTGWEILIKLIDRLSILKRHPALVNHEDWYREEYKCEPDYSKIIEQLTTTKEERVNLLKPFFEINATDEITDSLKKPTKAHKAIATLIKKGYVRVIITTNFDRLMENALKDEGIEPTVISNPNQIENVMPLIHSPITIIKINGDYLDTTFLNIESELNFYDNKLVELLKYVFENFGLITSGWSAKWDIGLRKILEDSNKFRFSNFFTYQNTFYEELKSISDFRNGKLIQVSDADSFFKEVTENLEALEKGERNNPLSKPIAIERLKKYILNPERKIELYELIDNAVQNDFKTIFNKILPKAEYNSIKELIEFETKKLDLLYSLLIEGVYWGSNENHELWLKAITKFAHPKPQPSSYAAWSNIAYFPALILYYSIGLTALLKRDFSLINRLLHLRIFNPYNEREKVSILQNVNLYSVFEHIDLNKVYETNYHVPISEFLYKLLKPELIFRLSDEKEYDEIFDEFELLNSLKYIELNGKNGILPGRYVHTRINQNNIIYKKFKDFETLKGDLDWLKAGLFNYVGMEESYAYFNETVKNLGYH